MDSPTRLGDSSPSSCPAGMPASSQQFEGMTAHDKAHIHAGNVHNQTTNHYYSDARWPSYPVEEDEACKELLEAASEGHTERVESLIDGFKKRLNFQDEDGLTALHHAARNGHKDTVQRLIGLGARLNAFSEKCGPPLCLAAANRHADVVRLLLDRRAGVSEPGGCFGSILHAAAGTRGNMATLQILLDRPVDVTQSHIIRLEEYSALCSKYVDVPCVLTPLHGPFATDATVECEPLFLALAAADKEMVNALLCKGSSLDSRATISRRALKGPVSFLGRLRAYRKPYTMTTLSYAVCFDSEIIYPLLRESHSDMIVHEDEFGRTALHWAIIRQNLKAVHCLIDLGIPVDAQTNIGSTALISASSNGDLDSVLALIQAKADVNVLSSSGRGAALHEATGSYACARILLEHGANPEAIDKDGCTALHVAARRGHGEVLKLLLDRKVAVDHPNSLGESALFEAVSFGRLECAQQLLQHGASVDLRKEDGEQPLHKAVAGTCVEFSNARKEIVELLLEFGAPTDVPDSTGDLPLHVSIRRGELACVEVLLKHRASANARNAAHGQSALHVAAAVGNAECISSLAERMTNINLRDAQGCTALMTAASWGHRSVVRELLQLRASMHETDFYHRTALHHSAIQGDKCIEITKMLVAANAKIDTRSKTHGWTPVGLAVLKKSLDTTRYLLASGANVHWRDATNGDSLLHVAIRTGEIPIIQALCQAGANVNAEDDFGNTPLLVAIEGKNLELVEILLAQKANPSHRTRAGETPLLTADTPDIIQALLTAGADVLAKSAKGSSALTRASRGTNTTIKKMLVEAEVSAIAKRGSKKSPPAALGAISAPSTPVSQRTIPCQSTKSTPGLPCYLRARSATVVPPPSDQSPPPPLLDTAFTRSATPTAPISGPRRRRTTVTVSPPIGP